MTSKQFAVVLVFLVAFSFCAVLQVHASRHVLSSLDNIELQEDDDHDAALEEDTKQCQYLVVTKTGDMLLAGTDSKFTFRFWDASNNTFEIVVDGNGPRFEQGRFTKIDPFTKKCMNPCRIKITTDGWGAAPAWYLEWIKVTVTAIGRSTYWHKFNVNQWIGLEEAGSPEEANMNECYGGVSASL